MRAPSLIDPRPASPSHHRSVPGHLLPFQMPLGKSLLLAFLLYLLLSIVATWPLAANVSTHLPKDLLDPLLTTWILWWHAHTVPFTAAWWDGLAFFPVHGGLALSDHRVGLSLIGSPLQWMGASPVAGYNVALLLSFALSALGAHALVYALGRHHGPALLAGVIYGFNPFRIPHIVHLEILSSYWMPVALVGLHLWLSTRDRRFLALFGVAWLMQALTCGYYFFYFAVLLGLWAVWFLRGRDWRRDVFPVALAGGLATLPLVPVLWRYKTIHDTFGLRRQLDEIERFSADVSGLLSGSPLLSGVPFFDALSRQEGDIFPGLVALVVVAVAVYGAWRRRPPASRTRGRWLLLVAAFVAGATALSVVFVGPWRVPLGPLSLSVTQAHKPLTVALVALAAYAATGASLVTAWRRQSAFAFYTLATIALWVLSFGPTPQLFGQPVLYKAPYAWLMTLPAFDHGLRAPARFAMLAAMTLAVAAGLGLVHLLSGRSRRAIVTASAALALVAFVESLPRALPLVRTPVPLTLPLSREDGAAVVELPLGDAAEDARAVYDAMAHRQRVANGFSGYDPPHYALLRLAVERREPTGLTALARRGLLLVAVRGDGRVQADWEPYVRAVTGSSLVTRRPDVAFYRVPRHAAVVERPRPLAPLQHVRANVAGADAHLMRDGALDTFWATPATQAGTEEVYLELASVQPLCGVRLAHGSFLGVPANLIIEVGDGQSWQAAWSGQTAGLAVEAALRDPRRVELVIDLPSRPHGRAVRLRQVGRDHRNRWAIAEVRVEGC